MRSFNSSCSQNHCFSSLVISAPLVVSLLWLQHPLSLFPGVTALASSLLHIKVRWWLFSHVSPSFSSVCVLVAYSMYFPTGSAEGKKKKQPAMVHHSSRLICQHDVTSYVWHKKKKKKASNFMNIHILPEIRFYISVYLVVVSVISSIIQ